MRTDAMRTATMKEPTDAMWRAVLARDAAWDDRFVYAVATTGVFCRPSCPSRHARREHVSFYPTVADASAAGYRACRRCRPTEVPHAAECVARAMAFIDDHVSAAREERLTLDEIAGAAGMSPFHLQRVFKRQLGVSPAQYLRARRAERLGRELRSGSTVSRATYDAGFSASSRAYDAATEQMAMTPATYGRGGDGATIAYRTASTPVGRALVAATSRGVCFVSLGDSDAALLDALREEYPRAAIERDGGHAGTRLAGWLQAVVAYLGGEAAKIEVPVDVHGTAFQWRVWRALQAIPPGETRSYAEVAASIGAPAAVRAVAGACASNNVALVIPCHRVLRADGSISGYRWGPDRKRALLASEAAHREGEAPGAG